MAIVGRSESLITEWLLDSTKYQSELKKLHKDIKAQEASEKRISDIQKKLESQTNKTAVAVASLGKESKKATANINSSALSFKKLMGTMTTADIASKAIVGGFSRIKDAISGSLQSGLDWTGTMTGIEEETAAVANSIDNLIPQPVIAKLTEYKNELNLSEKEFQNIAKASVHLARINKGDFSASLNQVTDMVTNVSTKGLRRLGIDITELSGTKSEKLKVMMDAINLKFGDMEIKASNADEKMQSMNNRMEDFRGKTMASLVSSKEYTAAMETWNDATMTFYSAVGYVIKSFGELMEYARDFERTSKNWISKGAYFRALSAEKDVEELKKLNEEWGKALALTPDEINRRVEEQYNAELRIKEATTKKLKSTKTAKPEAMEITAPSFSAGVINISDIMGELYSPEMTEIAGQMIDEQSAKISNIIEKYDAQREAINKLKETQLSQIDANYAVVKSYEDMFRNTDRVTKDMTDMSVQAFSTMASGIFTNLEAAKKGEVTFAQAMQNTAKSTLMSLGTQSLGKGAFEFAEGLAALAATWGVPNPASIGHFLASAKYLAFAAVFGGGGLAIPSVATKSTNSGSTKGSTGGTSTATERTQSTSFAKKESKEQTLNINLYLGAMDDPTAVLIQQKQLQAQLRT